jgi:predicted GIY-YIG superfamily endonuclease
MHLYILELEGGHYYVGVARDVGLRLWQHFKMGNRTGSAWTKKHKPISVIHISEITNPTKRRYEAIEQEAVLRIAKAVGFEKVRGAGYTTSSDEVPKTWLTLLDNVPPADFTKMTPPTKKELTELMKGKYEIWKADMKKYRKPKPDTD